MGRDCVETVAGLQGKEGDGCQKAPDVHGIMQINTRAMCAFGRELAKEIGPAGKVLQADAPAGRRGPKAVPTGTERATRSPQESGPAWRGGAQIDRAFSTSFAAGRTATWHEGTALHGLGHQALLLAIFSGKCLFYVDRLEGPGVQAGGVHQRGVGARGGCEDLHLLGDHAKLRGAGVAQRIHLGVRAARMGGHHVICQKLFFVGIGRCFEEALAEPVHGLHA